MATSVKPYTYIALVVLGFAAGVLVRDAKDDERFVGCKHLASVVADSLNTGRKLIAP